MASEFIYKEHKGKNVTTFDAKEKWIDVTDINIYDELKANKDVKIFYRTNRWVEKYNEWDNCEQDFEELDEEVKEELLYKFTCTHVVHFTENEFAKKIANVAESNDSSDFCFNAYKWKPEKDRDESINHLTWWAAVPPEKWEEDILKGYIPNSLPEYENHLGNSPAFDGESICGPIGFVVSWEDILNAYARSRGRQRTDVELRILGTFRYSAEIMYAILVCIKNDEIEYESKKYGRIQFSTRTDNTEAFHGTANSAEFTWKVYSTTGFSEGRKKIPDIRWTWDHVSFAFYFPQEGKEGGILKIPPNLCRIETKLASELRPYSRGGERELKERLPMEDWCMY